MKKKTLELEEYEIAVVLSLPPTSYPEIRRHDSFNKNTDKDVRKWLTILADGMIINLVRNPMENIKLAKDLYADKEVNLEDIISKDINKHHVEYGKPTPYLTLTTVDGEEINYDD